MRLHPPRIITRWPLAILALLLLAACRRAPLPPPVLLFDQGHGERFLSQGQGELDLSHLKEILAQGGFQVKASDPGQVFTDDLLQGVSTLVISGPFTPIDPPEIAAIKKFLNRGGQLCVMLHIAAPAANLLNALGLEVSNGVIHEPVNTETPEQPTNFFVTDLAPHPLTKGLTRFHLYGVWALHTENRADIIAQTSPQAWVDLRHDGSREFGPGDVRQAFSVVVVGQSGHGQFVAFGDDAIFQNRFLTGQNERLAENLAAWLKAGSYYLANEPR
ncbi:MAG: hypothetical protein M0T76_11205 [Desulfobacteraceae bacterium]|nr:hypothetical protein [Desulfobacteraceae bacterium]